MASRGESLNLASTDAPANGRAGNGLTEARSAFNLKCKSALNIWPRERVLDDDARGPGRGKDKISVKLKRNFASKGKQESTLWTVNFYYYFLPFPFAVPSPAGTHRSDPSVIAIPILHTEKNTSMLHSNHYLFINFLVLKSHF